MKRRHFLKSSLAAGAALATSTPALAAASPIAPRGEKFKLRYAPHFGMFQHHAGEDPIDELRFAADVGFTAWEDNGMMDKPPALQEKIGAEMAKLGMMMGVFVAHKIPWDTAVFATGDADARDAFLKDIRTAVDVAKRVNAKWMTVVPGQYDRKLAWDYQTVNVVETLKRAAEILEPQGMTMVLEPLNPHRDHPGMFLSKIPQAYMICKAVGSPACKILFDLYHQQITEGNLIPNLDLAWSEVAYVQIGDNPGRQEPTTGEINYLKIFEHLHKKGYKGVLGMEHGISRSGKEGEQALIEAYRQVDGFAV